MGKGLPDLIKDLKLSMEYPVGPKSSDQCPYKRQMRRQTQRSCHKKMEAETGGRCCKPRELLEPKKLEEAGRTLPWSLRRECSPVTP